MRGNRRNELIQNLGYCSCKWASASSYHDCCNNEGCGKVIETPYEKLDKAFNEIKKLKEEIEVLRNYGNKDCTAMADEELDRRRKDFFVIGNNNH
jgi:hypothetical protein